MTLDQILHQLEKRADDDEGTEIALFRDALAQAPGRLATAGLLWPGDGDGSTDPNSVHALAVKHTAALMHAAALEQLGDDGLEGWALANDYARAAYALGLAVGYIFAAGAAPARLVRRLSDAAEEVRR